jgi:photosystem II stability/assembly factor-like uncharacterized protein
VTDAAPEAPAQLGGPPRFFALHAGPRGLLLAGSCGRGATRSTDGGRTWQPLASGPGNGVVHSFTDTSADGLLATTAGTGVHRSVDRGETWTAAGLDGHTVHAVAELGSALVAGAEGSGLWRSDACREGEPGAWEAVPLRRSSGTVREASVYRILPSEHGAFLATDDGVWRYENGQARRAGLRGAIVYALLAPEETRLLAGTRGDGALLTDDGGQSWTRTGGLPDPVVHVLVADADGLLYAGTGLGVACSHDRGENWQPVGRAIAHHRIFSLAVTDDGELLAGSYDGVWILRPGASDWDPLDVGLRADDALALLPEPGDHVLAATSAGARRSADGGETWTVLGPGVGDQTTYSIARLASGRLLAGTNRGVAASDDDGRSWRPHGLAGERVYRIVEVEPRLVLAGTLGGGLWIGEGTSSGSDADCWRAVADVTHPMAFDARRTRRGDLLVATGIVENGQKSGGIFCSTDRGRTWQPAECPPITVYRVVEAADGTLHAGAQRSRVLRSTDGGVTWTFLPDTTGLDDAKLFALAIDGADRLYLGAGNRLLRSADGAATWDTIDDGLDGASVFDVATLADGDLLAATAWGVYRSVDDGLSWRPTGSPAA